MPSEIYSLGDLVRLTDATRSRVTLWTQSGLLTPSVKRAQGTGTRQLFDWIDLCTCFLLQNLYECGERLDAMRELVSHVKDRFSWPNSPPPAAGPSVFLLKSRDGVRIVRGSSFEEASKNKAGVLGVNLSLLQRELWKRLQVARERTEKKPKR
jgi:hypothetical protein